MTKNPDNSLEMKYKNLLEILKNNKKMSLV